MSISVLQKSAFVNSEDFKEQVNSIVVQEALYKAETWPNLDDATRNQLSQVVKSPDAYGFAPAIVSNTTWNMKYDEWADNPEGADGTIRSAVGTSWLLLTNIVQPPEPAPPAP